MSRSSGVSLVPVMLVVLILGTLLLDVFYGYQREISFFPMPSSWSQLVAGMDYQILLALRLPRYLTAFLAGSSLSLAGLLVQKATNNPLASPTVLGINSMASFFVALYLTFFKGHLSGGMFIGAFAGALIGGLLLFYLAHWTQALAQPERLILVGVSLGLLSSSLTHVVLLFDENNVQGILFWLLGGVEGKNWNDVFILAATLLPSLAGALWLKNSLETLQLGDDLALSLGRRPSRVRWGAFALTVLLVAGAVSTCGPIAFVGLIVPHICQKLTRAGGKVPLLLTTLAGGVFLSGADFLSRLVHFPFETPVGILSGILGSLYFLLLVLSPAGIFPQLKSKLQTRELEGYEVG